jgi:holo-[acyl-carrier protein] synthase
VIYGIGTDVVEIARIAHTLEKNNHFLERYYTPKEQEMLQQRGKRLVRGAAMNFAGKEAVAKALRTGICNSVRLEQIEILREPSGAPFVTLYGETLQYAKNCGVEYLHISLSDTDSLATAYVVAEKKEN